MGKLFVNGARSQADVNCAGRAGKPISPMMYRIHSSAIDSSSFIVNRQHPLVVICDPFIPPTPFMELCIKAFRLASSASGFESICVATRQIPTIVDAHCALNLWGNDARSELLSLQRLCKQRKDKCRALGTREEKLLSSDSPDRQQGFARSSCSCARVKLLVKGWMEFGSRIEQKKKNLRHVAGN